MLGVWFPGLQAFLALFAFLLGVAVMSHSILDCAELQGACENYRRNKKEECKAELMGVGFQATNKIRFIASQNEFGMESPQPKKQRNGNPPR